MFLFILQTERLLVTKNEGSLCDIIIEILCIQVLSCIVLSREWGKNKPHLNCNKYTGSYFCDCKSIHYISFILIG